jgi:N-acyl-D-amino-acid deacylase
LTGLPAAVFGLSGRGQLAAGMKADVVVFDPARFMEHATFEHPNRPATGILHLFVNGIHTVENGALTGNRGGVVLTRPVNRR